MSADVNLKSHSLSRTIPHGYRPTAVALLRDLADQIQASRAQGADVVAAQSLLRELACNVLGLTLI